MTDDAFPQQPMCFSGVADAIFTTGDSTNQSSDEGIDSQVARTGGVEMSASILGGFIFGAIVALCTFYFVRGKKIKENITDK